MNKKKILLLIIIILIICSIFIVLYSVFFGVKKNKDVGVKDVDFSSYEVVEKTSTGLINSEGVYSYSGELRGTIKIDAKNKVVKIILNNATITSDDGPAIYVDNADVVYIELIGENYINGEATEELNGAIYSKSDLLLMGDGTLNITSNIDGIVGKDDLKIISGTYNISANDDGIVGKDSLEIIDGTFNLNTLGDGIKTTNENAYGDLIINNGTFNIKTNSDGISSIASLHIIDGTFNIDSGDKTSNSFEDRSTKGIKADKDIVIDNGTYTLSTLDDSIHSNTKVTVNNGTFDIVTKDDGIHGEYEVVINDINYKAVCYEGVESMNITINGGTYNINAYDDGFNAAGGESVSYEEMQSLERQYSMRYTITINGGDIYVESQGDGIDSNGDLFINGGTIIVNGPTKIADGALDYGGFNSKFEITGGTIIAVGSNGMPVRPTSSTVNTVYAVLDSNITGDITIGDITFSPTKKFGSILITSDKLITGKTYNLKINNKTMSSVTISNTINSLNVKTGNSTSTNTTNSRNNMNHGRRE